MIWESELQKVVHALLTWYDLHEKMVEGYTDTAKETYIECKQRQEIIRAFTSKKKRWK